MFGFKRPKLFCENKNKNEFIEWFSNTKPWNKLNLNIIEPIIDKFTDDVKAFEFFVWVSEKYKLINNNYVPLLTKTGDNVDLALFYFSVTLYDVGRQLRNELIEAMEVSSLYDDSELSDLLNVTISSFEVAITLCNYCLSAYYQLAFLRGKILGKKNEGIEYCKRGLAKIQELKKIDVKQLTIAQHSILDTMENSENTFEDLLAAL
ncbi:MAG: hypothetical protein ABII27_08135 [bacterium]